MRVRPDPPVPKQLAREGPPERRENLTSQTVRGLRWTYFRTVSDVVLQLGYQAVISRMLDPATFGVFAIALLMRRFAQHFRDLGVGQAIIQKPQLDDDDLRVAFTMSLVFGLALFGVAWVTAPLVAAFFDEPGVVPVLRAMGVTFVVGSAGSPAQSVLRRELRFRELTLRDIAAYIVGFPLVGVALALMGAGVWSLVGAHLVAVLVSALGAYWRVRHPVRPLLQWPRVRTLYGFGGRISVVSFLEMLGSNLDTIIVGRYVTPALLGQYSRAFYLSSYPTKELVHGLSTVLFPSFSRMQSDIARVRRVYLGSLSLLAFVLLPVSAGLAVAAREVVLFFLGPQWDVAAAVLPVLMAAAAVHALTNMSGVVTTALAQLNRKLALQAGYLVVLVGLLLLARGHGLWTYAAALGAGEVIRHGLYLLLMRRLIGVTLRDTWVNYWPAVLTAAVVAGLIHLGRAATIAVGAPLAAILVVEVLLGLAGLLVMLRWGPVPRVRAELHHRLDGAGLMRAGSPLARVVPVVLGPRVRPSDEPNPEV